MRLGSGNLGRNVFTGPGVNNVDISLLKQIVLHDAHRIDFRIDVVNAFNHAQFAFWYYTQNISGFQFGLLVGPQGPEKSSCISDIVFECWSLRGSEVVKKLPKCS